MSKVLLLSATSPEELDDEFLLAVLPVDEPVSVDQTSLVLERRRRLLGGGMVDG